MFKKGQKVWYTGAYNNGDEVEAVVTGIGVKNEHDYPVTVYDVRTVQGENLWGYADQLRSR